MWDFLGLTKNDVEFPQGNQEKIMWNFQGSLFLALPWIPGWLSLVLSGIFRGKVKKWKIPGGFSIKYIFNPHVWIFLEQ